MGIPQNLRLNEQEGQMPGKDVIGRARRDAEQGKSPSTHAGELVRDEMHHIREGVWKLPVGTGCRSKAGTPMVTHDFVAGKKELKADKITDSCGVCQMSESSQ
jgi:hypothetical protein